MEKFFSLTLAAMFFFTGCGGNSIPKSEPPPPKQTEQPASAPKELTPEQKAAKETEKKAAEEKRIAEQKALEEKRAQEEARRQTERQAAEDRKFSLLEYGVQLDYTIEKLSEHKYKVSGATNLPDGMEIMITLSNRNLVAEQMGITDENLDRVSDANMALLVKNSFIGQSKPPIRNGQFSAVFGEGTNTLSTGEYELTISSPMNSLQPKQIQSILGDNGANLFGIGVIDDRNGKRISLEERVYLH